MYHITHIKQVLMLTKNLWASQPRDVPLALRHWITETGSFIKHLQTYGIHNPIIQVLQEQYTFPTQDERKLLHLSFRKKVLIREVLIHSQDHQWMYARTVFPMSTLTGPNQPLAHLKNRSI